MVERFIHLNGFTSAGDETFCKFAGISELISPLNHNLGQDVVVNRDRLLELPKGALDTLNPFLFIGSRYAAHFLVWLLGAF